MKQAAIGFRVHSGWSALVAVSLENRTPTVLFRERLQLVVTFSYKFRQPYHTAEKMPLEMARSFVAEMRSEARQLAARAIRSIQKDLGTRGYQVGQSVQLLASGKTLPSLDKILQSHALIHTADGELFREALRLASAHCGLEMRCIRERELLDRAVHTLRMNREKLLQGLTNLGSSLGSPWTQDEKYAALAAWLVSLDGV